MKKLLIASCISLAVFSASAAESVWTRVSGHENFSYSIKNGSVERSTNDGGQAIVLGIGRVLNLASTSSRIEMWYVELRACAREFGKLYTANTDGRVVGTNEFVFKQGTIAAKIAEVLCMVAENQTQPEKQPATKSNYPSI